MRHSLNRDRDPTLILVDPVLFPSRAGDKFGGGAGLALGHGQARQNIQKQTFRVSRLQMNRLAVGASTHLASRLALSAITIDVKKGKSVSVLLLLVGDQ